jgi:hypothetical protein
MRTHLFAGLALVALGILPWACTNKVNPPYPDQPTFCAAKAKAICQIASLCAIDATVCQNYQDLKCNLAGQQAIGKGTRTYSSDNAKTCIDAVNAAYGNGASSVAYQKLLDIETTCERVFTGTAMTNATCLSDYECANSLICSPAMPGSPASVCAPPMPAKQMDYCLNPGTQCAQDTYCAKQSNGLWLCTPAGMSGAACGDATPCVSTQHCVGGTCQPRAGAGGSCTLNSDCSPSFPYCDQAAGNICTIGQTFATGASDCKGIAGQVMPGGTPDAGASDATGQ